MFKKVLVGLMLSVLVALPAAASRYCSEPSIPSCVSTLGWTHDDFTFQMCHSSMERYKREVEEYQSCLQGERNDVGDDYNKAVRKFNCYASGQTICF